VTSILGYRSISHTDKHALKKLIFVIDAAMGANNRAEDRLATRSEIDALERSLEKALARIEALEQQIASAGG
jgi:hypothetical protein